MKANELSEGKASLFFMSGSPTLLHGFRLGLGLCSFFLSVWVAVGNTSAASTPTNLAHVSRFASVSTVHNIEVSRGSLFLAGRVATLAHNTSEGVKPFDISTLDKQLGVIGVSRIVAEQPIMRRYVEGFTSSLNIKPVPLQENGALLKRYRKSLELEIAATNRTPDDIASGLTHEGVHFYLEHTDSILTEDSPSVDSFMYKILQRGIGEEAEALSVQIEAMAAERIRAENGERDLVDGCYELRGEFGDFIEEIKQGTLSGEELRKRVMFRRFGDGIDSKTIQGILSDPSQLRILRDRGLRDLFVTAYDAYMNAHGKEGEELSRRLNRVYGLLETIMPMPRTLGTHISATSTIIRLRMLLLSLQGKTNDKMAIAEIEKDQQELAEMVMEYLESNAAYGEQILSDAIADGTI